jgi:hypothetical protein
MKNIGTEYPTFFYKGETITSAIFQSLPIPLKIQLSLSYLAIL